MRWYNLPELLPPVYDGIQSMHETAETENTELLSLYAIRTAILANFFVQTCDVKTLQYWEQLLDIELFGDETIDARRQMVLLYLASNWQITKPYVKYVGEDYFGEGNFSIEYDEDNHLIVSIRMIHAPYNQTRRFIKWFEKVCPAHIQWLAVPTFPSESMVYMTENCILADKMRMTASCSMGSNATLYNGSIPESADWMIL